MQAIDRWRKWRPIDKKLGKTADTEPSKPSKVGSGGFEGTVSGENQNFFADSDDSAAWQVDFNWWMSERTIHRAGCDDAGGIRCLWSDFCSWAIANQTVRCVFQTFERLLIAAEFEIRNGMVLGLVLREDYESVRNWPARQRGSR
jgi:hypothetical protein